MECSCRLWPSPGMYAVTSIPLESRTRATFRSAEFGFLGVIVLTTVQTPRFCGHPCMAGCFGFDRCGDRGFFVNWLIVGIPNLSQARRPGGVRMGSRYSSKKSKVVKTQVPSRTPDSGLATLGLVAI